MLVGKVTEEVTIFLSFMKTELADAMETFIWYGLACLCEILHHGAFELCSSLVSCTDIVLGVQFQL